jgi:hypothetical protein
VRRGVRAGSARDEENDATLTYRRLPAAGDAISLPLSSLYLTNGSGTLSSILWLATVEAGFFT